ncbi:hypothetical protein VNO77_09229 [Canavalia gladiata]|uniref:Uncharacterized protein n=1 Tax=Canavalia gladiata TaxID=3824 RepID=A0AAN9M9Q5_CANGL
MCGKALGCLHSPLVESLGLGVAQLDGQFCDMQGSSAVGPVDVWEGNWLLAWPTGGVHLAGLKSGRHGPIIKLAWADKLSLELHSDGRYPEPAPALAGGDHSY